MAEYTHVVHTIDPTYDSESRVLVLGSVPSPKSRETGYNYGHPQNRFWRVLAAIAAEEVPQTNEENAAPRAPHRALGRREGVRYQRGV